MNDDDWYDEHREYFDDVTEPVDEAIDDYIDDYIDDFYRTLTEYPQTFDDPGSCDYDGSYDDLVGTVLELLKKLFNQFLDINLDDFTKATQYRIAQEWVAESATPISDNQDYVEALARRAEYYSDEY